jgi:hypothetical protein
MRDERNQQHSGEAHDDAWTVCIEELFIGRLSGAKQQALYAHLKTCAPCERLFDRYAQMERLISIKSDRELPLSVSERARVQSRLFAASEKTERARKLVFRLTMTASALAACALLAVSVMPKGEAPTSDHDFTSRGSHAANARPVSLRALSIHADPDGKLDVADLATSKDALTSGDRVKLLYSNDAGFKYMSVALIGVDGRAIPLAGPVEIKQDAVDAALDQSVAIPEGAPEGDARIVALFSMEPTPPTDVRPDSTQGQVRVLSTHLRASLESRTMPVRSP